MKTGLGQFHGKRKADVPETDDTGASFARPDLVAKSLY
jgi:hypothetical protein